MNVKSKRSRRTWRDPDDAPEITAEWAAKADLYDGKKLVRRGRPTGSGRKTQTTVRISNEVLAFFRASGPGWQTRMDAALKKYGSSPATVKETVMPTDIDLLTESELISLNHRIVVRRGASLTARTH